MLRRILFPLILGLGGIAILLWLGFWQVDRLGQKQAIIAEAQGRIAATPTDLPVEPDPSAMNRNAVRFTATPTGDAIHILASGTAAGTGYRAIIAAETLDGRRVLLDLGLLPVEGKDAPLDLQQSDITGNLLWPDDINSSTPDPDLGRNIWFGRDVPALATALETEPLLVVVRQMTPPLPQVTTLPVDTANFKNDHREYAITWFLLAVVWAAMTGFLILRTLRPKDA